MKKSILLQVVPLLVLTLALSSCGGDTDEPKNSDASSLSKEAQEVYNKLSNTTWTLLSSPYDNAPLGSTITFSSTLVMNGAYQLLCSNYPNDIFAWLPVYEDVDLMMTTTITPCNASNAGAFNLYYGTRVYLKFSGDRMTMTSAINSNKVYIYTKSSSSSSSTSTVDGENGYEKPDVGFYDYTQQGRSSVKVDFIIYNKDEAGVTSATIKYGTSSSANSSVSTSIVGDHAIATISGAVTNFCV